MIRKYVRFVVTYPRAVVAVVLAISLVLGASIRRLQVILDIDAQIPQGHHLVVIGKRLEKLLAENTLPWWGFIPARAPSTRRRSSARSSV
jgi:predicted RND superfamily exporter protein